MKSFTTTQKFSYAFLVMLFLTLSMGFTGDVFGQAQRNPVLEFCTGVN